MPTSVVTLTSTWTEIQVGPADSVAIQAGSRRVRYRVNTSTPAADASGHVLSPDVGHTVRLESGENLYARSDVNLTTSVTVTV